MACQVGSLTPGNASGSSDLGRCVIWPLFPCRSRLLRNLTNASKRISIPCTPAAMLCWVNGSSGNVTPRYSQLAGSRTAPGCIEDRSKRRKCCVQYGSRGSAGLCSADWGKCAVAQLGICGLSPRFRDARHSRSNSWAPVRSLVWNFPSLPTGFPLTGAGPGLNILVSQSCCCSYICVVIHYILYYNCVIYYSNVFATTCCLYHVLQ